MKTDEEIITTRARIEETKVHDDYIRRLIDTGWESDKAMPIMLWHKVRLENLNDELNKLLGETV